MPFTPFVGISTVVHLLIIAWHKCIERIPNRYLPTLRAKKNRLPSLILLIIGCLIMIAMLLFVLVGAIILVYSSSVDEHSTLIAAGKFAAIAGPEVDLFTRTSVPYINSFFASGRGHLLSIASIIAVGLILLPLAARRELIPLPHIVRRFSNDPQAFLLLSLIFVVILSALIVLSAQPMMNVLLK